MALERRSLREQIRDALVGRIVAGALVPGQRLVELRIAEEFGTSQAPVREALRELIALGLVEGAPNRGTFVRSFWQQGLQEIYLVRGALEEAATRAAMPLSTAALAALQQAIELMRAAAAAHDIDAFMHHSVQFHRQVLVEAGNTLLLSVWDSLQIETRTTILVSMPAVDLMALADSHQPLLDAMAAGEVEAACRLAREHQAWIEDLDRQQEAGGRR
jgi:DNA-binding GntR family transcriptional regulator